MWMMPFFFLPRQHQEAFAWVEFFGACVDGVKNVAWDMHGCVCWHANNGYDCGLRTFSQQSVCLGFGKHLRHSELELLTCQCRGGRVVNARALRARGTSVPHGFESHPRRSIVKSTCFMLTFLEKR